MAQRLGGTQLSKHGDPKKAFISRSWLPRTWLWEPQSPQVTHSTTIEEKPRAILKYHFPVLTRKLRFTMEEAFSPASMKSHCYPVLPLRPPMSNKRPKPQM